MIDCVTIPQERMKEYKKLKDRLKELAEVELEVDKAGDGNDIVINDEDSLKVMRIKEVVKAFGRGFEIEESLNLLDEDFKLEIINIPDFCGKSRDRLITMRGRLIGRKGKTKAIIERLLNVKISVYGKTASILGKWDDVQNAREAVEMILTGCKHGTVYRFLEERKSL